VKKTLILDCNNLCYSAFHTFGELSFEEKKVGVIFGFLQRILFLANKFETTKFIFCWDSKKNYRKILYPEYKANRRRDLTPQEEIDYALAFKQFDALRKEVLPKLGFANILQQNGYEADDLLAEIVLKTEGDFIIVSTDKDLYQLLNRCDIYNQKTKKIITAIDFKNTYDIDCSYWVQAKSLMGDAGDNIPGISGVGVAKAIQHIKDKLPDGVIRNRILSKESEEIVIRNTKLIKLPLKRRKKIKINLQEDTFNRDKFIDVFVDFGFESFLRKKALEKWVDIFVNN